MKGLLVAGVTMAASPLEFSNFDIYSKYLDERLNVVSQLLYKIETLQTSLTYTGSGGVRIFSKDYVSIMHCVRVGGAVTTVTTGAQAAMLEAGPR